MKINFKCVVCGVIFGLYPSQVKYRNTGKYCSRNCYDEYRKPKKKVAVYENSNRASKKIKSVCLLCENEFVHFPSRKRIFCSRNCADIWRTKDKKEKTLSEKKCLMCKKSFNTKRHDQKFCSRKCSCIWLTTIRNVGTNHPRFKTGIKYKNKYPREFYNIRKIILGKHSGKCFICKKECRNIHHIDYDRNNNDEMNLIPLCSSCHAKTNHERAFWEDKFNTMIKEMECK